MSSSRPMWFMLGHEPLLSLAELHQFFPNTSFVKRGNGIAAAPISCDAQKTIKELGGTVKIAEQLGETLSHDQLLSAIENELRTVEGKIHFGLSALPSTGTTFSPKDLEKIGLTIKKNLKATGLSVRYVDNRGALILSAASVINNGLTARGREFLILPEGKTFAVAKTLAVQPFEAFSDRDFGRPGRDDVSGMLPPKLAMMMLNCAGAKKTESLYDPSCGSGTIVSEAALLGFSNIIGSDISDKAVADAERNIHWLLDKTPLETKPEVRLFTHDIRVTPSEITPHSIGTIVSEPYMGPPLKGRETEAQLHKNTYELLDLYRATFKTFAGLLKPGATVVYSFPRFGTIRTSQLVMDDVKKLGFTVAPLLPSHFSNDPFVLYQRASQHVGREIWKLVFKK